MDLNDSECQYPDDLQTEGQVTYELPLRLVLNLDDPEMGGYFAQLCPEHRQQVVDQLTDLFLKLFNLGGGGFGALVRSDLDAELTRLTTTGGKQ